MEFTVAVFKDPKSKWYIGQCVEVRGAISQGRSLEELLSNMKEAISLIIECQRDEIEKDPDWKNIFYRKVEI
ncbi:MAG: type II toxin-antitoxin system HicB family antitoxin [Bacteroidales bacterium]|nr:type II toxin-antitoxin system HicB family antitoxin [Bacteroidales bacterium]MBQ6275322.1 type II toxin-antitoxin system HicB family antitoxin [Bacteroidales bacterium]